LQSCTTRWNTAGGGGGDTVIALDYENNFYDIGYQLFILNIK